MDDESKRALEEMQNVLEKLLSGQQNNATEVHTLIPELQTLAVQINQLIQNLNEMNRLALDLSQGKLDGPIPPRHNYMAGPLKQLHSQLSTLTWGLRQLRSGYIVGKLDGPGELFDIFNELVDQVMAASTREAGSLGNSNIPVPFNSWRYHQILKTFDLLHVSVLEVDGSGHVVYANHSAKELFGDIDDISGQTKSNMLGLIAKNITISKEENSFPISREVYEEHNSTWYQVTSDRFIFPTGQVFYFNTIEDISEWKINEHQLKISATVDEMTGTYNRKTGLRELEKILARSDPSKTYCIAFVDIDGLKTINDNYGHSEGDYTIKSIAKVLLSSIRSSDMVCRYGGDEFLIIFKDCTEEVAETIITRMCEKLNNLDRKNPKPYTLSFSHGVTPFSNNPRPAYRVVDLLDLADKKMYQCKNKKKQKKTKGKPHDG